MKNGGVANGRPGPGESIRVLRVIGRLNVGGPAIQAIALSHHLEPLGYETTLIRGVEGPAEGSMDPLAKRLGVSPRLVPSLKRELGPHDIRAVRRLTAIMREERPHVLHTHAAKAGTIGRIAAQLAGKEAPRVLVHTFHGHALSGYFPPSQAAVFKQIERTLARRTTRLIAVADEVRDDLIRLGVAKSDRIEVIPLGLDLCAFVQTPEDEAAARRSFRSELGIAEDTRVVTLVARLVPIKRVDRFLRIARMLHDVADVQFMIVGDGELRGPLQSEAAGNGLRSRVIWTGFRHDMPRVMAASDIVALTSGNEGTPVSLIEAQAAARPVVAAAVGGVPSALIDGETGVVVAPDDEAEFASAIRGLLENEPLSHSYGARGREYVLERFPQERLVGDIDHLYRRLLQAA